MQHSSPRRPADIPVHWIRAAIQVESAGNAQAISPREALGLKQIMPETWVELGVRYDLGIDPLDPRDNILAAKRTFARFSIGSDQRAFLRPTMRVRGAMKNIWLPADRFLRTREPMSLR